MEKEAPNESALHLLAQQRRIIVERIKELQVDLDAIRRAEEILSTEKGKTPLSSETLVRATTGYANLKAEAAILTLMKEGPPSKSWKPAAIGKQLLKEGFKSDSKHLTTIIFSSLKRLVNKGEVEKSERKHRRPVYKIKEKISTAA